MFIVLLYVKIFSYFKNGLHSSTMHMQLFDSIQIVHDLYKT